MSDIDVIKSVSGNTTKLYGWLPGMMCHILHVFGPEKYGGKGNIRIKAEEEAARTGECTPSLAPDSDEEEGSLVTPASEVQEEDADGMARIADVDIAEKLAGLVLGGLEDQIQEACEDAGVCGFELHTIAQA